MKLIAYACAVALVAGAGAAAQSTTTERHEKQKIDVKSGRDVRLVGCLERAEGGGYILADVTSRRATSDVYALAGGDDLAKLVGERVEVKGKAADRGHDKVKVERETGTSGSVEHHSKTEAEGRNLDLPVIGVKSVKGLNRSCR